MFYLWQVKNRDFILSRVKERVSQIDSEAKIILFGSRARSDAKNESDWDFLILTSSVVNREYKNKISDILFETELETGQVITAIVQNRNLWNNYKKTPIYKNIHKEGILLWV